MLYGTMVDVEPSASEGGMEPSEATSKGSYFASQAKSAESKEWAKALVRGVLFDMVDTDSSGTIEKAEFVYMHTMVLNALFVIVVLALIAMFGTPLAANQGKMNAAAAPARDAVELVDRAAHRHHVRHQTVVFDDGPGRLGNQMFRYAAAFGIACTTGARLMRRRDGLTVCRVFPRARGCGGESFDALQQREGVRLSTIAEERRTWEPARWDPLPGSYNLLTGYRQSPVYWAGCEASLREQLVFAPAVAHAANALLNPLGVRTRPCITAYHRQGDVYSIPGNPYHNCLPEQDFYEQALPPLALEMAGAASAPPTILTSSHSFDAARFLGRAVARAAHRTHANVSLAAFDHDDPAVVMAALSRCQGVLFSHGTFNWWIAYLNGDATVLFDSSLLNFSRHRACYLEKVKVVEDPYSPDSARAMVGGHLPRHWRAVQVGK